MSPQHLRAIAGSRTLLQGQMTRVGNPHTFSPTMCSKQELKTGKIINDNFFAVRTCSDSIQQPPPHLPCRDSGSRQPASALPGFVDLCHNSVSELKREPTS